MDKKSFSFIKKLLRNMLVIVFVSVGLWSFVWVQNEFSHFKSESKQLRSNYVENNKKLIQNEVERTVQYIQKTSKRSEGRLNSLLQERVYEAHSIATHIYQNNIKTKTLSEVEKMIKDALRPIRFFNGRGYFFAVSLNGIEKLYPVKPEFEGKNVLNLRDSKGSFVIQDEIEVINNSGEGFVKHFWTNPERKDPEAYLKISFVKLFKPLNWYIGTGEYLDEAIKGFQLQALEHLVNLRFGEEGYLFGSMFNGDPLFSNGKITIGSDSVWDLTDPNGVKIIQEQSKMSQKMGGGFVDYSYRKLEQDIPSPKTSFVKGVPEWGWTIGAGFYLDTIELEIAEQKNDLLKKLKEDISRSILVIIFLLCLVFYWTKRTSNQINQSISSFSSFLKKASTESITIDPDTIQVDEFKEIANSTNKMLEDRILAEEALKESEKRYRITFEAIPDSITMTRVKDGRYKYVNDGFCNITGYSRKEVIGKTPFDISLYVNDQDRERMTQILKRDKILYNHEIPFRKKDGTVFETYFSARPVVIDNEDHLIALTKDVTEMKQAEKERLELKNQLHHAQKMESIGQLAGGIAHDFNNILYPIMGFTQLSQDALPDDHPVQENLSDVLDGTKRASDLVKRILLFSRQREQELKPTTLQPILIESYKLLRALIPKNIDLTLDLYDGEDCVLCNETEIHEIILNLCTNAYHAIIEDHGKIIIGLKKQNPSSDMDLLPGNFLCISVKDTGMGIPEKIKDKIFEPYATTKDIGKGSGLGLSIVYGIVQDYKGEIQVESEPDNGTEFSIFLPVTDKVEIREKHQEKHQEKKNPISKGKEHILFVDDEESITKLGVRIFEKNGYTVTAKNDSKEALEIFKSYPDIFDLVLTDMSMPGMVGSELAKRILKIRPDIPIIICSGYNEKLDSIAKEDIKISAYLDKPLTVENLLKIVGKTLNG